MTEKLNSVSEGIRAYRKKSAELRRDAKADARKRGYRDWHFVGRGCELLALDDLGERNDDLGEPDYISQKDVSVGYLKGTVEGWLKSSRYPGNVLRGRTLTAISLNHGLDVYDSFTAYMDSMKDGGGAWDYEISGDWASEDIPIELFNIKETA